MATVGYRLITSKGSKLKQIHVYLSVKRNEVYLKKTGYSIESDNWSVKTKRPKQGDSTFKILKRKLDDLSDQIEDSYTKALLNEVVVNSDWLGVEVSKFKNEIVEGDLELDNLLVNQVQYIIDNASTKRIKNSSRIGLSANRVKSYKTFKGTIEEYERKIKIPIRLTDINSPFVESFKKWLMNEREYSTGYSGKVIDNLRAVCIDASNRGVKSNPFAFKIESFKEGKRPEDIVFFNEEELLKIRNKDLDSEKFVNVRNWLLIGCEIGQRGGDLFNLNPSKIRFEDNDMFIDVRQEKTGKDVTIPIFNDYVKDILINSFPRKISIQKFNLYLKDICELCEINNQMFGKVSISGRKVYGKYPKYKLVSSHICRRTYASNNYKHFPTPVLMEITGHSKESIFLDYIGKSKDKDDNAKLFLKLAKERAKKIEEDKRENKLKIVG